LFYLFLSAHPNPIRFFYSHEALLNLFFAEVGRPIDPFLINAPSFV